MIGIANVFVEGVLAIRLLFVVRSILRDPLRLLGFWFQNPP